MLQTWKRKVEKQKERKNLLDLYIISYVILTLSILILQILHEKITMDYEEFHVQTNFDIILAWASASSKIEVGRYYLR